MKDSNKLESLENDSIGKNLIECGTTLTTIIDSIGKFVSPDNIIANSIISFLVDKML